MFSNTKKYFSDPNISSTQVVATTNETAIPISVSKPVSIKSEALIFHPQQSPLNLQTIDKSRAETYREEKAEDLSNGATTKNTNAAEGFSTEVNNESSLIIHPPFPEIVVDVIQPKKPATALPGTLTPRDKDRTVDAEAAVAVLSHVADSSLVQLGSTRSQTRY